MHPSVPLPRLGLCQPYSTGEGAGQRVLEDVVPG